MLNHELGISVISLVGLARVDITYADTTVLVEIAVRRLMHSDCSQRTAK